MAIATPLFMASCATGPGTDGNGPAPSAPMQTMPAATMAKSPKPEALKAASVKKICKVRKNVVEWVLISGGCKNGYAHGSGDAQSVDRKRRYTGNFVDGEFSGKGEYDWGNGAHYTGEILAGKKHGSGTLLFADNSR